MVLFCVSVLPLCINQRTGLCFMAEVREGLNTDLRTGKPNLPFGDESPPGLSQGGRRKPWGPVWAPQPCPPARRCPPPAHVPPAFASSSTCSICRLARTFASGAGDEGASLWSTVQTPGEGLVQERPEAQSFVRAFGDLSVCVAVGGAGGFKIRCDWAGEERFRKVEEEKRCVQTRSKCWGDNAIAADSGTQAAGRR